MDAYDLVEQRWPFDGPHSEDTVTDAATAVNGLVRYLANATWPHKRVMASGPAVYRLTSALKGAAVGLNQVLEQLETIVEGLADDPSMYDDRRDRPAADTARQAAAALAEARQALPALTRAMERATSLTCHLGHDEPARRGGGRRG